MPPLQQPVGGQTPGSHAQQPIGARTFAQVSWSELPELDELDDPRTSKESLASSCSSRASRRPSGLMGDTDLNVRLSRSPAHNGVEVLSQLLHLSTGGKSLKAVKAESQARQQPANLSTPRLSFSQSQTFSRRSYNSAPFNSISADLETTTTPKGPTNSSSLHHSHSVGSDLCSLTSPGSTPQTSTANDSPMFLSPTSSSPVAVPRRPRERASPGTGVSGTSPVGSLQHMLQVLQVATDGKDLRQIRAEIQARKFNLHRRSSQFGTSSAGSKP